MAVYPAGNPGVIPIESADPNVYALRLLIGDTQYEAYDPAQAGFGNFTMFSDAELSGFYAMGQDSILRGAGYAYLQLAAQAALESKSIKDYDLQVDATKRAGDLRQIALMYFDQADQADLGGDDAFEIVPTGRRCNCPAELAGHYAWCHCW